jgi:hypothetical protein
MPMTRTNRVSTGGFKTGTVSRQTRYFPAHSATARVPDSVLNCDLWLWFAECAVDLNPIQAGIREPPEASDFICVKAQTTTTKNTKCTKIKSEDRYVLQHQRRATETRLQSLCPLPSFVLFVSFVVKEQIHNRTREHYYHEEHREHEGEIRESIRRATSTPNN